MKTPKSKKLPAPTVAVDDDSKWRAEDALRTLTRAEEVRGDKKLMAEVEKARQEKMRQLASIKVETSEKTIKGQRSLN